MTSRDQYQFKRCHADRAVKPRQQCASTVQDEGRPQGHRGQDRQGEATQGIAADTGQHEHRQARRGNEPGQHECRGRRPVECLTRNRIGTGFPHAANEAQTPEPPTGSVETKISDNDPGKQTRIYRDLDMATFRNQRHAQAQRDVLKKQGKRPERYSQPNPVGSTQRAEQPRKVHERRLTRVPATNGMPAPSKYRSSARSGIPSKARRRKRG